MALALSLSAPLASGQQNSPLQGQGTNPDGVTDVYFSAYLQRLLKVDDIEYQVWHEGPTIAQPISLPAL